MSDRGAHLARTADRQISELTEIVSACGEAGLLLPCPGRERLGDGTVAACARHTTENYQRIAGLIRPNPITDDGPRDGDHTRCSVKSITLPALLGRLTAARDVVAELAGVEDDQLDSVATMGALRFADGQRTLEQVIVAALKHQEHQIDAVRAAAAQAGRTPGDIPRTSTAPGPST